MTTQDEIKTNKESDTASPSPSSPELPPKKKWWWPFSPKESSPAEKVPIHRLFRFATPLDKCLIACAILSSMGTGAMQPISVIYIGDLLNGLTANLDNTANLLEVCQPMIMMFVYLASGTFVTSYLANCFWILTGENQARRMKKEYLHAVMHQEMAWFDQSEEGSLVTRLSSDIQIIQDGISEKFGLFIVCLAQFVTGFVVAFAKGWNLAVVMIACIPAMSGTGYLMVHYITKYTILSHTAYAEAGSIVEQVFSSVRTVFAFSLQNRFSELYEAKLEQALKAGVARGAAVAYGYGTFMFSLFAVYGLSFWYASRMIYEGVLTSGTVMVVLYSMMMGATSLLELPTNLNAVTSATGAAYKIFDIIDRKPKIDKNETADRVVIEDLKGEIEFSQVRFSYPTRPDLTILDNFNLTIKPGQTVALVGPSGSGKSTTIQLLQRLYDPTMGHVLLDGIPTQNLNLSWLRQQFGIVSQEPVLFNMSIRQNILLGVADESKVTEEDLINACIEANCHAFISKLPEGYDTFVGEQGSMLSGGQKQRIAIARAILKNPPILLLDEATSALDTQSERLVQVALDNASTKRTTIVIAHRLSTIRNADKILVLSKGQILETGTHKELVDLGGMYADLVKKQEIMIQSEKHTSEVVRTKIQKKSEKKEDEDEDEDEKLLKKIKELKKESDAEKILDAFEIQYLKEQKLKERVAREPAPFSRILSEMRPEWPFLILGLVGAVVAGGVFPVYTYFFARVIASLTLPDTDLNPPPFQGINLYSFLFVVFGIGSFLGFSTKIMCFELAGERYARRLRAKVFRTYLKQEVGFFDEDEHQVGALTTELAVNAKSVHEMVTNFWGEILQAIATSATGLIFAFVYSWTLSLIMLLVTPFIAVATFYETRLHTGYEHENKRANAKSGEVASEAIQQIRTVTCLNQQKFFEDRYSRANQRPHQLAARRAYLSSISYALLRAVLIYNNAIAYYAGIRLLMLGKVSYGDIFISMMCVMVAGQGVGHGSTISASFARAKIAAIATFEVIDRQSKIDPELEGIEPPQGSLRGDVALKAIEFAYPSRPDVPIFTAEDKLDIQADAYKTIAFVGPSGCGKSTLVSLLERWYSPSAGTITLDQHPIDSFSLNHLRSHMALVGQEPVLFDLSIGENIRFGVDPDIHTLVSQDDVVNACKAANIHEFIMSLPEGYETRVGAKGSQLSGGQKQRIAIARAFIRKPTVLLLDEATSALDSDSEKSVQAALDDIIAQGGRTTITIAHRLSTIQHADFIYVMKDGQVIEKGTHWELLNLGGFYAALVQEQSLVV